MYFQYFHNVVNSMLLVAGQVAWAVAPVEPLETPNIPSIFSDFLNANNRLGQCASGLQTWSFEVLLGIIL